MKKVFFSAIAVFAAHLCCAQTNLQLPSVLPPAPNAAELGKVARVPVSLTTGSMATSIPMVSLNAGTIKTDISVSYNAGGIKVDQVASRAGMGWVLNAGGMVNRTVYDNADERSTWRAAPPGVDLSTSFDTAATNFLTDAALSLDLYDTQPDVFSFNFNGYSGRFFLDPADRTKVIFLEHSNLKVATNFHYVSDSTWTLRITDAEGRKYFFGGNTATESSRSGSAGTDCGKHYSIPIENAWYLKRIEDLQGNYMTFTYRKHSFEYWPSFSQNSVATPDYTAVRAMIDPLSSPPSVPAADLTSNTVCASTIYNNGVFLQKIVSSNGSEVRFWYGSRPDVPGDSLVTAVKLYAPGSVVPVRNYGLEYTTSSPIGSYYTAIAGETMLNYRPFLVRVSEYPVSGSEVKNHYFAYNRVNDLPPRLAFAQDEYGFFNGQNNINFLPAPGVDSLANYFPNSTANRSTNPSLAGVGMLSRIIYPTGGQDSVVYESNDVYTSYTQPAPKSTITHHVTGTGNRGLVEMDSAMVITAAQKVSVVFSCTYNTGVDDGIHQVSTYSIFAYGAGTPVYTRQLHPGDAASFKVDLDPGTYTVQLSSNGVAAQGFAATDIPSGRIRSSTTT
ncbi:hypothetical protein [Hufsiella ginkgonis]|uniref:T9SS C-terminal target domain-containing protein n=1 Tax=Hufsiella ginkgonis TaxID=2695274 RepID=A0A7K1XYK1_9SPHI|nr:hypothetical protein [Hufsiella ginkgonis]MXV15626.1 hypothetical protein [Hufsiella ginkgonis]